MQGRWQLVISRVLLVSFLVGQVFVLSGCSLLKQNASGYKVDLEVWGVFDDSSAYTAIFSAWQRANPFIGQITYKKFDVSTYKQDLLDALAAGHGPDIFMVRNSWLPSFQDKIVPVDPSIIDERAYRTNLVDVAADDFIGSDSKIYGMPISVDSLALYYNKDLLSAAGISAPPATWEALKSDTALLTQVNAYGGIDIAGIALGTWDQSAIRGGNINRATDIFMALMAQKGLVSSVKKVDFGSQAAQNMTDFYLQFSNGQSAAYSWNPLQHYSIDAFSEGRLAMMLNYSWHYETIKKKNAKLNIGVAPLPQFAGSGPGEMANLANYWGFVVAKNTPQVTLASNTSQTASLRTTDPQKYNEVRVLEAWEFLKFFGFPNTGTVTLISGSTGATKDFAVQIDPASVYLANVKKPAARRDLIEKQKLDPVMGPFADGNLIAKTWYERDPETIEGILNDMLASIVQGQATTSDALRTANTRLGGYQLGQ